MNLTDAVKSCLHKYVTFSGRAVRSEFWYWELSVFVAAVIAEIADKIIFATPHFGGGPLYIIVALAAFLPGLSVAIRRLHDIDRSGWWFLINFIPIIGSIIFIIWMCTKGTLGPNRFGL